MTIPDNQSVSAWSVVLEDVPDDDYDDEDDDYDDEEEDLDDEDEDDEDVETWQVFTPWAVP